MGVNFEELISKHAGEDGNIPAANIAKVASAISSAVGREFVAKERYNAKLDEIETLKGEKQAAEDNLATAGKWEKKYADLKAEYEGYKADTEAKAKLNDVKTAYRKLLKEAGIDEKRFDAIVRATNFDGMKLDANGRLENTDALKNGIEAEWADFKVTTKTQGAPVANPPANPNPSGANSRAAELAKQYHERLYGTPTNGNKTE